MFEFLKRLPEGPYQFVGSVEIERSAAEVFPLIDLTDPRFAKRQLGERVLAQAPGAPSTVFTALISTSTSNGLVM